MSKNPENDQGQRSEEEPVTAESLEREFGEEGQSPATEDDDEVDEEDGEDAGSSSDDDTDDGEDYGDSDLDDSEDEDEDEDGEEGDTPKDRTQQRIDELTAARREADRAAAEATRQAEYWRGRAEGKIDPEAKGEEESSDAAPDPAKYEFGEADSKYITDVARYEAKLQYQEERERDNVNRQVAELDAKYKQNVASAIERYPDYAEKVDKAAENQLWKCPPVVALGIRDSDVGPDVAYHLATTPAEADRIAALHPVEQAREFGRLEAKYLFEKEKRDVDKKKAEKEPKPKSSAPPPPKKQPRGGGGKFKVKADTDDFAAFDREYGN